ncbi:MAG: hypothetical protein E6Q83_03700 [Thiothrix sp.]|nr:MAG: hypothetical protein E6Q83_03700 [Thiothrix sp.]
MGLMSAYAAIRLADEEALSRQILIEKSIKEEQRKQIIALFKEHYPEICTLAADDGFKIEARLKDNYSEYNYIRIFNEEKEAFIAINDDGRVSIEDHGCFDRWSNNKVIVSIVEGLSSIEDIPF